MYTLEDLHKYIVKYYGKDYSIIGFGLSGSKVILQLSKKRSSAKFWKDAEPYMEGGEL